MAFNKKDLLNKSFNSISGVFDFIKEKTAELKEVFEHNKQDRVQWICFTAFERSEDTSIESISKEIDLLLTVNKNPELSFLNYNAITREDILTFLDDWLTDPIKKEDLYRDRTNFQERNRLILEI